MSEAVQFWLDNKMSTGIRVAGIGNQLLVLYRDKFYLVEKGAAHMRGRKPLRYSRSSLPVIWKKALSGEAPVATDLIPSSGELPPATCNSEARIERIEPQQPALVPAKPVKTVPDRPPAPLPPSSGPKPLRNAAKPDKMPAVQAMVMAKCPYCSNEIELSPEKGRTGKPFFHECGRCRAEFAVRFVPVMIYQARVAGFRRP